MGIASRYLPAFSSSIAFATSGESVNASCARACAGPPRASAAIITPTISLSRGASPLRGGRTVDAGEVVQDRTPLVGGQSAQLLPRRRGELDRRLGIDGAGGRERLVTLRGRRLTLPRIVALFLLQRASRVQQSAEELLLTRQRRPVEAAVVERVGELASLARELRCAVAPRTVARILELIGNVSLLSRQ